MQNARFKPMHVIEAKLCRHLVFQMSFRNIQRQKSYHNFWGDRSELWLSILSVIIHLIIRITKWHNSCNTDLLAPIFLPNMHCLIVKVWCKFEQNQIKAIQVIEQKP